MLTGLVYAAVVTLWAVVLVPRWLRRHDRNAAARTTVTFHRAMATLGRRRPRGGASRASHNIDVVVAGARGRVHDRVRATKSAGESADAIDQHLDDGTDPFMGGSQEQHLIEARLARSRMIAREIAARRRRQVKHALIGAGVIALVLYVMGLAPLAALLLPPFALGGMWFARQRVSVARDQRRRSATRGGRQRSASGARSARRRPNRHVEPAAGSATVAAVNPDSDDVRLLTPGEVVRRGASSDPGAWDAVEAPLPSYVAAARADRRARSRGSDDWTARRMLEQAEALRKPGADREEELGLDEYVVVPDEACYGRRRAVNE